LSLLKSYQMDWGNYTFNYWKSESDWKKSIFLWKSF